LVKESQVDRRALKGKIVYLKDARADKDLQPRAKAEGVRSLLAVPLTVGTRVIGVLKLYTTRIREFGRQEIKFIEAVASLSAIALENAMLHDALQTDHDLTIAYKYRIDDN
jgi:GAF domain-containing protein